MIKHILLSVVTLWVMAWPSYGAPVMVHLDRSGALWVAWIPHQPTGVWAIQASTTGIGDDWFYPPSQYDDGLKLQAPVPMVGKMFFRARKLR